jgi:hypothetical protein
MTNDAAGEHQTSDCNRVFGNAGKLVNAEGIQSALKRRFIKRETGLEESNRFGSVLLQES